jgi:hypothetical protein
VTSNDHKLEPGLQPPWWNCVHCNSEENEFGRKKSPELGYIFFWITANAETIRNVVTIIQIARFKLNRKITEVIASNQFVVVIESVKTDPRSQIPHLSRLILVRMNNISEIEAAANAKVSTTANQ